MPSPLGVRLLADDLVAEPKIELQVRLHHLPHRLDHDPPGLLADMPVTPTRLVGGGAISVTVSITHSAAPLGTDLFFTAQNKILAPTSVKAPVNQTSHTFLVPTATVTVRTSHTITARRNGVSVTKTITLDLGSIPF